MSNWSARPANGPALRLEELEGREVPAVLIQIDYSYDNGFFANNPDARATLEQVAAELGNSISADLSALTPGGGNTWTATFFNPATGGQTSVANLSIGANTIKVFAGARATGTAEAGFGGFGGYSISGTQAWINTVQTRNWSGFAPWGGSITFDSAQNWNFSTSTSGLTASKLDFYSVATHEMGHLLGIGTSNQWKSLSSGGYFHGSNASGVYGGAVPLGPDGAHWADGITVGGHAVSLDPTLAYGQRVNWSSLDAAALRDLGWSTGAATGAAPSAAAAAPAVTLLVIAGGDGVITQYAIMNGAVYATGNRFVPFAGYRGALQQTFGDFDGDGVLDVAVATPYPGVGIMTIVSGLDGHTIGGPRLAYGGILALVAGDFDGNGRTDVLTVEGTAGGGYGVYVYEPSGGSLVGSSAYSAYGEAGRAALHVGESDVNRAGYGDALAPDQSNTAPGTNTPAPPAARLDGPGDAPATYTVSIDPVRHQCTCAGCQALARLAGAYDAAPTAPAPGAQDELLSTIRVA
jgi:hypothetical protein